MQKILIDGFCFLVFMLEVDVRIPMRLLMRLKMLACYLTMLKPLDTDLPFLILVEDFRALKM